MSMNICVFTGNIGQDAEMRKVRDTDLAEFSLAVNMGFGENKKTEWVRCTVWGKRAQALAQYLVKGQSVAVSGEISAHAFVSKKDGEAKAELRLRVEHVELMGSGGGKKREAEGQDPPFETGSTSAPAGNKDPFEI